MQTADPIKGLPLPHRSYDLLEGQIRGTVHVTLPRAVEIAFLDIMQHTAHHANARIPLYRLAPAQRDLERSFRDSVVSVGFNLQYLLTTLRTCRLYDYDEKRWLPTN